MDDRKLELTASRGLLDRMSVTLPPGNRLVAVLVPDSKLDVDADRTLLDDAVNRLLDDADRRPEAPLEDSRLVGTLVETTLLLSGRELVGGLRGLGLSLWDTRLEVDDRSPVGVVCVLLLLLPATREAALEENRLLGTKPEVLNKTEEDCVSDGVRACVEEEGEEIASLVGEEDSFCFLLGGEKRGEIGSAFRVPPHNSALY